MHAPLSSARSPVNFTGEGDAHDGVVSIHVPARIRFLAIDMDGTLLNSQRQLSEANRAAVQRAAEAGVTICLASGRAIATMRVFREQMKCGGPMVTCNGAYAVGPSGECLLNETLPPAAVAALVGYACEREVFTNVYSLDGIYSSHGGKFLEMYRQRTGADLQVIGYPALSQTSATKLLYVDEPHHIPSHHDALAGDAQAHGYEITLSERDYIEFLPKGVNKGVGVQAVVRAMGFAHTETAAIGDWLNDLEMLKSVGFAGAPANACDAVKEVADVVVSHHDNDAVAEFIDRYVLG